jgi:hypothetical protein
MLVVSETYQNYKNGAVSIELTVYKYLTWGRSISQFEYSWVEYKKGRKGDRLNKITTFIDLSALTALLMISVPVAFCSS